MQMYIRPFTIMPPTVAPISVGNSSAATQINANAIGNRTIRIVNSGSNIIFLKMGNSAVTATTSDTAMLPNTVETFLIHRDDDYIAFLGAAAGNTVYITLGDSA